MENDQNGRELLCEGFGGITIADVIQYKCIMKAAQEYKADLEKEFKGAQGVPEETPVGKRIMVDCRRDIDRECTRVGIWMRNNRGPERANDQTLQAISKFRWTVQELEDTHFDGEPPEKMGQPDLKEIRRRALIIAEELVDGKRES